METSGVLWDQEHSHPSEEILEQYAMSRSDPEQVERIEEHLLICSACRDALDEADRWVAIMKCALPEPDDPSFGRSMLEKLVRLFSPGTQEGTRRSFWNLGPMSWAGIAWAGLAIFVLLPARALIHQSAPQQKPQQITLVAMRGADPRMQAVAGRPFRFDLKDPEPEAFSQPGNRLQIISPSGTELWSCALATSRTIEAPALQAGSFWIRILNSDGQPLKEYGLIVR
jgi:hypothetical protein